jgi:hypothetical protein
MIERVVVTSFPGYVFMSVLCIRSIQKFLPDIPITVLLDDFGIDTWQAFPKQYQDYLNTQFNNLEFANFSLLKDVDSARMGGWFRQQLVKLHVDQFVQEHNVLLIDADVVLEETPRIDIVPAIHWPVTPISTGFQLYAKFMLGVDPWLGTPEQNLGSSWVPFRYVTRDLLQALREHVESRHGQNFLQLHIDLMQEQKIVAFDPESKTMIMSEFEMLEVFRKHLWKNPLPLSNGTSRFYHTSQKDWNTEKSWFAKHQVQIDEQIWSKVKVFGSNPAIQ